jgi:hypothetical protein
VDNHEVGGESAFNGRGQLTCQLFIFLNRTQNIAIIWANIITKLYNPFLLILLIKRSKQLPFRDYILLNISM